MATPKEALIGIIKEWVDVNTELTQIQKSVKKLREQKKQLTETLTEIMKSNEIDCFDINNGKIMCRTSKVKSPINKVCLMTALEEYFSNSPNVDTIDISDFILNKRTIRETSSLVIKHNK